jgi:protein BCP1
MPNPQQTSDAGSDSSYTSLSSHEEASNHCAGDDQEDEGDVVNVDLEFYDPSEIDFLGLKALLRSLLDGDEFHGCSDLVEAVIRQVPVLSGIA